LKVKMFSEFESYMNSSTPRDCKQL